MIVLDASAVVGVLLNTPPERVEALGRRLRGKDETIHVPHLVDLEVAQVIRRFLRRGEMTSARADVALEALRDLPAVRYPHVVFLPRIWQLRDNLTAYDAVYVALAEALDAPLATLDARLQQAPGHRAVVELF